MTLKETVLASVDPKTFYQRYFPDWDGRANVSCPFHKDTTPSFNINPDTGQAYCHAASCPEKKFASLVHFYERYHRCSEDEAVRRLARLFGVKIHSDTVKPEPHPALTPKRVAYWHEKLLDNPRVKDALRSLRGISEETAVEYHLGYDPSYRRLTIPVYNAKGKIVNVRQYDLIRSGTSNHRPKIIGVKGAPCSDLYPIWKLQKGDVLFFGGEMDCLLARQAGFNAVTSLAGEGYWNDAWVPYLRGRKVWICVDYDQAGRVAAKKLRDKLTQCGIQNRRVILPFRYGHAHKDFTDWVVHERNNPADLALYLRDAPTLSAAADADDSDEAQAAALGDVMAADKFGRKFRLHCLVSAKTENPYIVPTRFRLTCSGKNPACPVCMADDATVEYEVPRHSRDILRFLEASDGGVAKAVAHLAGVPSKCYLRVEVLARSNLHEVWVIPDATYSEGAYTMQKAYFTGDAIEANTPYELTARLVSEPQNQKSALLVTKASPTQSVVEAFRLGDKEAKVLSSLQCNDDVEAVFSRLCELAEDHAQYRTHIIDRQDLHLAIMLTYHSPLHFYFDEDSLERGWMNTLVLGDTASGKSKVAERLRATYRAGEWTSAENCSFMGLVGGLMPVGRQWVVRWGKVPLNDRRLVVVEELSGLTAEEISRMTDVRSSGVARIDKGGHSTQTTARTRLVFLSNTRRGRNLQDFPSGAAAVSELIGNAEDIRRFDLIVTTRNSEVSMEKINRRRVVGSCKFPDEVHRLSVLWAWSLTPKQVVFETKALDCCMKWALKMSSMYHASIPIFKGEDGRYKLARVSAAIAAQVFSHRKGKLIVKECHVLAAVSLLNMLYRKASMGYDTHSKLARHRELLGNEKIIAAVFARIPEQYYRRTVEMLIAVPFFTPEEFGAMTDLDEFEVKEVITTLYRERGLNKEKSLGWSVTPQLREWLESRR